MSRYELFLAGIMAAILLGGIVAVVAAYRSIEAPAPATA
jgi:hypothetical protein